ncbi:ABC transporter substrate-binding protein [Paraburkholderia kirstenboschensis]|uniref:Extracellular solute-binding protein n=1 Tax=Paraburkholderia kirstenboschensis TaxID=1245436 RepID=A0ABZ0EF30_9BURK|nr:extracellular solute-binding protein [Paraburkholderia kirstenboschensis]WOD14812.1 extracellular solute-binding protein [Paraburkholderia kirstenboschensis]
MHPSRVELRVLGTTVTLQEHIRKRAEQDLGIRLRFIVQDGGAVQRDGAMHPDRYELYDQWFHSLDCLWPTHALQPIELARIRRWDEVNVLPRTGRIGRAPASHATGKLSGAGCTPADRLYVQPDGSLARKPSERISMLPLTHNADSFVYLEDAMPASLSGGEESWAWLLAPELAGRVALQADAAIGAIDAALAVQASGLMRFDDIGNLSIEEIDGLIAILIDFKRRGHFAGFWSSFAEAAQLMIANKVAIQSIWSPATVELERAGLKFRLARPREGYRAWFGGIGISRLAHGRVLDAAYEYLNWWLEGWAGATVARQGFYISNPEQSRAHMEANEWAYWYDGARASADLPGPISKHLVPAGQMRDGGSYVARMSRVAVWDSVMDEHNYLVRRWTEFMRS